MGRFGLLGGFLALLLATQAPEYGRRVAWAADSEKGDGEPGGRRRSEGLVP